MTNDKGPAVSSEDRKKFEPKHVVENMIASIGDIPESCTIQVQMFAEKYRRLIDKMDEYEWRDLFKEGVKLKEKEDAKAFLAEITKSSIDLYVFFPDLDKEGLMKIAQKRSGYSLLHLKLKSLGLDVGPLNTKMTATYGEVKMEIINAITVAYDEKTRIIRLVYA